MEDYTNPPSDKLNTPSEVSLHGNDAQDKGNTLKILTGLDLDAAYTSEKLVNLHVLLMHLMTWENDLESMAGDERAVSEASIEKAMVFELLHGILESELQEVVAVLDVLKEQILDATFNMSLCRRPKELVRVMDEKLNDASESLKQSQEQVLEIKMQLARLQRTFSYLKYNKRENPESLEQLEDDSSNVILGKSKEQTSLPQQRVLRMLEKSLSRELDLEKKLSELEQNEEQLKLKLHYTEQVAWHMEEASEFIFGRLLEAENASEVLMGISMELRGRFQLIQFNLNRSNLRETELKSKLEDCMEKLKAKDCLLESLRTSNEGHERVALEMLSLREKISSQEGQLKSSELELRKSNSIKEERLTQIEELESVVESLKESIYVAENRAENAEAKIAQLTDMNLELTEEVGFLKESESNSTKKVTLLEKQLRDLEMQLQNSEALSKANQELYSAIWDMETLIEDLKSRASKAESKTEVVEDNCIALSETNAELNDEVEFLRKRIELLEGLLEQANNTEKLRAEEVSARTKLMMDTVMQLSLERERIHKQLHSLTWENELLRKQLQNPGNPSLDTTDLHVSDAQEGCVSNQVWEEPSFAMSLQAGG